MVKGALKEEGTWALEEICQAGVRGAAMVVLGFDVCCLEGVREVVLICWGWWRDVADYEDWNSGGYLGKLDWKDTTGPCFRAKGFLYTCSLCLLISSGVHVTSTPVTAAFSCMRIVVVPYTAFSRGNLDAAFQHHTACRSGLDPYGPLFEGYESLSRERDR
jgi:hypothetical protein